MMVFIPEQSSDPEWLTDCRRRLSEYLDRPYRGQLQGPVGGGCINRAWRVSEPNGLNVFIKTNACEYAEMFRVEALGLEQLRATRSIRLPKPLGVVSSGEQVCLMLEWLPLGDGQSSSWQQLGVQLAAFHTAPAGVSFGWEQDNFIGTTPQFNQPADSWADFFLEQRLDVQIEYALKLGRSFPDYSRLRAKAKAVLEAETLSPAWAWVHGDLWAGNAGFLQTGEPVVFDVACYRGDPEVDIAMTQLFGGFPAAFYQAYDAGNPPRPGRQWRAQLYNLYHLLNHDHLFGGGYAAQAQQVMSRLCRQSPELT